MLTISCCFSIIRRGLLLAIICNYAVALREKRQLFPGAGCFDICSIGIELCQHGGVCQMDPNDCNKMTCDCSEEYTGEYCQTLKSNIETTPSYDAITEGSTGGKIVTTEDSKTDSGDRICFPGFECVHGICDQIAKLNNDMKCTCEEGWTGMFCDKRVLRLKECFPGFVCVNGFCAVNENILGCKCDDGWTGSLCSEPIGQNTTTPSFTYSTTDITETTSGLPRCSFPCLHGECDREYYRDTGGYRCKCESGYVGEMCHERCPLDCGEQGTCEKIIDGKMRCLCFPGYYGDRCHLSGLLDNSTNNSTNSLCGLSCENNGTCVNVNGTFECECKFSYSGALCEIREYTLCDQCVHGGCDEEFYRESGGGYRCKCDDGYSGELCQVKCEVNCGPYGRCVDSAPTLCACHADWGGPTCSLYTANLTTEAYPHGSNEQPVWHWYIVGACVVVLVILVLLLVILPYILWKKRVFFIMKIIYYLRSYEDDDEKLFDAFVSYKSDNLDESFVVKTLHPKLENELNFKLCLHYRDFVPGETIANNIIWAIQNSRRTILLVSPRYVESEWARMEYQKAQHEMLKLKHKIIPVLLEDISNVEEKIDENLKMILETVTYVEWPGAENEKKVNNFWKRLELNLPKKKKSECLENVTTESIETQKRVELKKYKHISENSGFTDITSIGGSVSNTFDEISLDNPPAYDSVAGVEHSRSDSNSQEDGDAIC